MAFTEQEIKRRLEDLPEAIHRYVIHSVKPHGFYRMLYEKERKAGISRERHVEFDNHLDEINRISASQEAFRKAKKFLVDYMML